ncbi:MAG: hypothetical protein VZR73_14500 [Acutalibacteraceae bacterium]|nr:hypothetical protein [Acutalibacteraceae bacterium]
METQRPLQPEMYRRLRTLPLETLLRGGKYMDLQEIMQEAQQAIGGDYEYCR